MLAPSVAAVNTVLMLHADVPLPLADVARAAGVTYAVAQSALRTLERHGLVVRTSRAGRDEVSPDRESLRYPAAYLEALVDLPLGQALQSQGAFAALVYGSLSTPGGGTRHSDLDLLVVGDIVDRAALTSVFAAMGARIGRRIDPLILTPEQYDRGKARRDAHLMSALAGVRIWGSL